MSELIPQVDRRTGRVEIAGVLIDPIPFPVAIDRILERALGAEPPAYVVTPNAQHVVMLQEPGELRRAYDDAWLILPDGMPLVWAARLLGTPVSGKVSGSDLFQALCRVGAGTPVRFFLFGGKPGAADSAARVLTERYPGLQIAGTYCPPMGFERDPAESEKAIQTVRAAAPHVLFVALGAPKQEIWMRQNAAALGVPVSIGVGGSFDFVAGLVPRAPKWMRNAGMEWLHRLSQEPGRLWKRYAVTNPRFAALVLRQLGRRSQQRYWPRDPSPGPSDPQDPR